MFGTQKQVLLQIQEGQRGLETYINDRITSINDAYKEQFVTFLESVVKQLKPGKK